MDTPDINWTLDHIRQHIEQGLPLVPLFNIDVIEASAECSAVRLREGNLVTLPGASVAGNHDCFGHRGRRSDDP